MKIIQEKDYPLLERKTLVLELEYPKAPPLPRPEVKKRIAAKFKVDEKLIAIQKIKSRFGGKYLRIICNIYKNEALLKKLEKPKKKDQPIQEPKKEEVKKEEVKENAKETKKTS